MYPDHDTCIVEAHSVPYQKHTPNDTSPLYILEYESGSRRISMTRVTGDTPAGQSVMLYKVCPVVSKTALPQKSRLRRKCIKKSRLRRNTPKKSPAAPGVDIT